MDKPKRHSHGRPQKYVGVILRLMLAMVAETLP
jgi:hypothetical protein